MAPYSAAPKQKVVSAAAANALSLNKRTSSNGAILARSAWRVKAVISTTPMAMGRKTLRSDPWPASESP